MADAPRVGAARELGDGVLGRAAAFVYWHLVVGVLLCLATLPSVVLLMLLGRSAGNALLVPLCLVPAGPALAAGLFALRDRTRAEGLAPARAFLRGYRLDWADALRVWTPACVALGVVAGGIANVGPAGLPGAYAAVLLVVGVLVLLWALNALTLAAFFGFRTRDTARLAAYYLARPRVTAGLLALVVVAVGVVWLASEAVLWLFAVVLMASWRTTAQPMVDDVTARFTVEGAGAPGPGAPNPQDPQDP